MEKKGKGINILLSLCIIALISVGPYLAMKYLVKGAGEETEQEMVVTTGPNGNSRPVDIEPVEGIRIKAAENAMDKDREITLAFADGKQWARAEKALKDEPVTPLCAFEFDAGMGPQETIPGDFEISMDLGKMGIPPELYDRVQIWRLAEDGTRYRYSTRMNGSQLCFRSNQNSLLLIAIGTAFVFYGTMKYVHAVQEKSMKKFFMTGNDDEYDNMEVPVDDENGDFTLYFKWSSTERPGGGKAFLDNENEALARVEELGKQVDAEIERRANKMASGKEELGWWDSWMLSDKREAAKKTIDREALLQQYIEKDPVLTKLNSSPDAQLPHSILQIIQMVKLSNYYLNKVAKVRPLDIDMEVYLVDRSVIGSDNGRCVKRVGNDLVGGQPFLLINADCCILTDGKTGKKAFSVDAKYGQSTLITVVHELFHARQQTLYCPIHMGMYAAEATAAVLEFDAARWFFKNGIITANVDAPDNDNLQMSPRENMEVFARSLNEISVTDKYSILDLGSPSRLYNKTVQEIADASDVGYTMGYVIEAAREFAGKPDRSMHYIVEQYPDHGSSFSELVRYGIPLSEDKWDKAWNYFCDSHMNALYERQYTLESKDQINQLLQECYTKELSIGESMPVHELKVDQKDFYFRTWHMGLSAKSKPDFNLFVTDKTDGTISPYVSFYLADGPVGFKDKGNKSQLYIKGPKHVKVAAAVSSYSKEKEPDKYYAVALFKPREIRMKRQNKDTVVFTLPPVGKDLQKYKLITGAEVTFYPAKGENLTLTVPADKMDNPVTWVLDGLSKDGGQFALSVHWFYKESDKVVYESPESDKNTFTAVKFEEEESEEPIDLEDDGDYDSDDVPQGLIRPTIEVPYVSLNISPYGLISKEEDTYLSCVKSPAVWGFHGECWAEKGEISITYEGKGRWHIECNASYGDFEEGKNKTSSVTISMSLYYQMRLGDMVRKDDKYVFEGIEESLSGSYNISYKKCIQSNCEWYDYDKSQWHYDYCTDSATASGSFKDFTGWNSSYKREGSQWLCQAFSGIPLSYNFQDSFYQRVGDDLVNRHVDATLDDLLALKAETERRIANGENLFWEGGRGFVTIDIDIDLDKDGDPTTDNRYMKPLTYSDIL